jgi:hemolysin III
MVAQQPKKTSRVYDIVYEVLNAVTHGLGFAAAVVGFILLILHAIQQGADGLTIAALSFYMGTVAFFLLASTLFHSLVFTRVGKLFQFFDHAGIYLVILGTYTPYMWSFVGGTLGWGIWLAILVMTLAGFVYDLFYVGRWPWVAVIIYLVMGWLVVLALPTLLTVLSPSAFWLLVAGGVVYSLGTIFYLVKGIPMAHVYWHIFVIAGATLMYISVWQSL